MEPFEDIVGIPKEALNPQPFRACVRPWVSRWFLLQNALCAYAPSFILDSWLKTLIETHRNFVAREKNLISFCNIWPSEIYLATALDTDGSDLFLSLAEISSRSPRNIMCITLFWLNHDSIRIYQNIGDSCPLQKSHEWLQIPKAPWDKSTKSGLLWSRAGTLQDPFTNPPRLYQGSQSFSANPLIVTLFNWATRGAN